MAQNYDTVDLRWTWNGDYSLSAGDLADTSSDMLLSLRQEVHTVCASSLKDWENYPFLGATIDDFIGAPNNKGTAAALHDRLKISLIAAGVVAEEDLAIRIVPVHASRVLILLGIKAAATAQNELDYSERIVVSMVFDTVEQQVVFFETTPQLIPS